MAQTTLNLIEHVLPLKVPLRQWVFTVPFELRARLGYDGALLSEVTRIFTDSILRWYRRRLRGEGVQSGQGGAVVVVQRTSSDLRLDPHIHAVFLDGVYAAGPDGAPVFHPLPRLSTTEVADALQVARVRILRRLVRTGVIASDTEGLAVDDALAARDPAWAHLAAAAVRGCAPAGPSLRRRPVEVSLRDHPGAVVTGARCVEDQGFSLHAATHVAAWDDRGKEALVKYVLRPPLAQERVKPGPDGLVRLVLKKPFSDGTFAIDLSPLALLGRLAAAVPPPKHHTLRYAGVLAAASLWRPLVVPPPPPPQDAADDPTESDAPTASGGARSRYRPWAELLRRTWAIDREVCPRCGGPMRLIAWVKDPAGIARYLRSLGEPTEPPPLAPARAPPYFRTTERRRATDDSADLFDA